MAVMQTSSPTTGGSAAPLNVAIAGGGTAGWMAAAALARLTACKVTLVESDAIGTVGVGEATIPQIRLFNRGLGIDEAEFLRETKGTFKLGIEFEGWRRAGPSYMHAFGNVGAGAGLLPFHHLWLRGRELGSAKNFGAYSLNEAAARAGRMQMWPADKAPQPDMPWAYHFDATLYAAFLRRFAETRGVTRIEGRIETVERAGESGDIAALVIDGGRRIEADFYIDCTGFRGLLAGDMPGQGFEDWSHWLPCDRAIAVPCKTGGEFTPYTRAAAHTAGWKWRIPLQHRIGNGLVYCSDYLADEEAEALLLADLDGEPLSDPRTMRFTTGMRRAPWSGNCLALGLAAGFMEPLESTSIHLIQSGIARFLSMLPRPGMEAAMAAEFNRQSAFEWSAIRDFLILHYAANERSGEPFWDRARTMDLPASLATRIELFRSTGYLSREHDELFTEAGWTQVLLGQGILPRATHANADALDPAALERLLAGIESDIAKTVGTMPGHAQFLRATCMPQTANRPAATKETAR